MNDWSPPTIDREHSLALANSLSLHPLIARVLCARGMVDISTARLFLAPRLADLTRPDAMAGRTTAAERIDTAINRGQRIVIFGDYDVDGTTSAAILTLALREMGADVQARCASRFMGGYGLSDTALTSLLELGPELVITCDCGTSDHDRLAVLKAKGIDAIVVDHHKVPDQELPVVAFLNPHRSDCGFPYKHLASAGLALSLAAAVRAQRKASLDLRAYLDLVAIGTIADVAPLTGDNRILVRAGLERLAQGLVRPGIAALLREANLKSRMRAFDVAFQLGPLLNAPGRLGAATPTLELFLAVEGERATQLAQSLVRANESRRKISQALIDQAISQVAAIYPSMVSGIVVAGDDWHPGVGGIVAGRLVERTRRPSIVIALETASTVGVGSARAPKGFPLYEAIASCGDLLVQFGGHDAAAGLKIQREKIPEFRQRFGDVCTQLMQRDPAERRHSPRADTEIFEADLDDKLADSLDRLEPSGESQSEPRVLLRKVRILDLREVGIGHLRAKVKLGSKVLGMFIRDGVGRRARGELVFVQGDCDVLGLLTLDTYMGNRSVQIHLLETQPCSS